MKTASDQFTGAFCNHGTITATCACGITFFATYHNDGHFDSGELEDLRNKRDADASKYVELDQSSVHVIHFGAKDFVVECACGGLVAYEKFIWHWRDSIMGYLKTRIEQEYKLARLAKQQFEDLERADRKNKTVALPGNKK